MNLSKKIFKIFGFVIIIAFLISIFKYQNFYKKQIHKVQGYYYVYLGDKYYKKGEEQLALDYYKQALKFYPSHYRAWHNLANIYVSYEDYFSALECYEKALEINPAFINARINYAIILSEITKNDDKAIQEYQIATRTNKKMLEIPYITEDTKTRNFNKGIAFYNMGVLYRGKSKTIGEKKFEARKYLESARLAYQNAINVLKNYDTFYNLAIVHHLKKEEAISGYYYCKAIEASPLRYEAHFNLGILLREMKKYPQSLEEFKKAGLILDLNGDTNKIHYVYDILNDTSKEMVAVGNYEELVKTLNEQSEENEKNLQYKDGKVLLSDEYEKSLIENFSKCADKEYFEENYKENL